MRTRTSMLAALAAAVLAAGCGSSTTSCPTESPQVNGLADCSYPAGATVNYHVQLCPTCNQTLSGCDVDLSAVGSGYIHLNPLVEVCQSASSCGGAGCATPTASGCSFTAPSANPGTTFNVSAYDPVTNTQRTGRLTILASGDAPFCSF